MRSEKMCKNRFKFFRGCKNSINYPHTINGKIVLPHRTYYYALPPANTHKLQLKCKYGIYNLRSRFSSKLEVGLYPLFNLGLRIKFIISVGNFGLSRSFHFSFVLLLLKVNDVPIKPDGWERSV